MLEKIHFPSRKQAPKLHAQIIKEYEDLLELSNGKKKGKILDRLAEKYGYSCGQSVRNMMNNKKQLN